jgi:threonine synthase
MNVNEQQVSLGEGNTPLVRSVALSNELSISNLHFKLESNNPTGSFKDRFAVAEVARMLKNGKQVCLATSSGNTGSSLAAYCARYGIGFHLFINEQTPQEKLLQARAYGALIYRVRGFGVDGAATLGVLEKLQELAAKGSYELTVSAYRYCPDAMDNLRSICTELVAQLGKVPEHVFVPVGGGGLLTAIWRGFSALRDAGVTPQIPRIHAVQPAGNPTVYDAWKARRKEVRAVTSTTLISGLSVPFDIDASYALDAVYATNACAFAPTDEEIWDAQRLLSSHEGIYSEPAGATSLAGTIQAVRSGCVQPGDTVVCLVTGHGFKDARAIERMLDDCHTPLVAPEEILALDLGETSRQASCLGSSRQPHV